MDLFGPNAYKSLGGNSFGLVIVDNFSRFTWVYFLRLKSKTTQALIDFIKHIELILKKKVQKIKSDNDSEFKNNVHDLFLTHKGISHNFSLAYNPQQNGVVERWNHSLCESLWIYTNDGHICESSSISMGRSSFHCMFYSKSIVYSSSF